LENKSTFRGPLRGSGVSPEGKSTFHRRDAGATDDAQILNTKVLFATAEIIKTKPHSGIDKSTFRM
jgi:hypothetical protein